MINEQAASAVRLIPWKRSRDKCEAILVPDPGDKKMSADEALLYLIQDSPALVHRLEREPNPPAWYQILVDYILPARQSHSNQLAISFVGPGNSGKSTILNSLLAPDRISARDFSEGSTSRLVLVTNATTAHGSMLVQRFRRIVPWESPAMTVKPGPPVVFPAQRFYKNLILIDAPSFDIQEHHRAASLAALWGDVLVYVFTYTNYRNEFNIQTLRDTFRSIGEKPVILIFRAPASMQTRDVLTHLYEMARAMFPNSPINPKTRFPDPVQGTYALIDSPDVAGGQAQPSLKPLLNTDPFPVLLDTLNLGALKQRRQSLQNNFKFVINGIDEDIQHLELNEADVRLTDKAFRVLLRSSVDRSLRNFPHDKMATDLHEIAINRKLGLHAMARFIGHPFGWFSNIKTSLTLDEKDTERMKSFLNATVDHVISVMLLAASRGYMNLPKDEDGVLKIKKAVDEIHERYNIPENEAPYIVEKGDFVELHLPRVPEVTRRIDGFLNRDWDHIADEIKKSSLDNVFRLIYIVQADLEKAVGRTGVWYNTKSYGRSVLAVTPAGLVVLYMFMSGAADIKTAMGLAAAVLWARFLSFKDTRKPGKEWLKKIGDWFHDQQLPFFTDVFNRFTKFDPQPNGIPVTKEFYRLRSATRRLKENPPAIY